MSPLTNDTINQIPADLSHMQNTQDPWLSAYYALPAKLREEYTQKLMAEGLGGSVEGGSSTDQEKRIEELVNRVLTRQQEYSLEHSVSFIPRWVTNIPHWVTERVVRAQKVVGLWPIVLRRMLEGT